MLPKPDVCKSCPLYGDGFGWVPDTLVEGPLVVIAQNPDADEESGRMLIRYDGKEKIYEPTSPQPLIGVTGYDLRHTYLPLTGVPIEQVSLCNILKCRWQRKGKRTNDLPTGEVYKQAVEHCTKHHLRLPSTARLVVAMGGPALKWTQGQDVSVTDWRGYLCEKGVECAG